MPRKNSKLLVSTTLIAMIGGCKQTICEPEPKSKYKRYEIPIGRCALTDKGCPIGFVEVVAEVPLKDGEKCEYEVAPAEL